LKAEEAKNLPKGGKKWLFKLLVLDQSSNLKSAINGKK
jgi:hypothetical protein